VVDCTLGGGGHAEAILESFPEVRLIGIDRDEKAIQASRSRLSEHAGRVRLVKGNYRDFRSLLEPNDEPLRGVLYDLGVSSPQLDSPERGFQYRGEHRLDMRMDRSDPKTAAEVVNEYPEMRLAEILRDYGDERFARRIAKAIAKRRSKAPFETTEDLAEVVKEAIPAATRRTGPHPARRTFQALRIEVNDELKSLEHSLPDAVDELSPGGRVVAISYHSGEDRIVKKAYNDAAKGCTCPPDLPVCVCGRNAIARVLTKKPVRPTDDEVSQNRRAKSARLRAAERLGGPPEAA
jgi:16S rRNA (cytosine1402-N4)-methyltransferase